LFLAIPAHPQGCAQCRDTVGQTPARTQTAYRRAIILMVAAGSLVFGAALVTLRRFR
jgi:hypothetical protein